MTRTFKIIFTVSLLLNLLFLGLAAGCLVKPFYHKGGGFGLGGEAGALVGAAFEERRPQIQPVVEEMRATRDTLRTIIEADTFDRAAYDRNINEILDNRDELAHIRAQAMADVLEQLPADERKEVGNRILRSIEGKYRHGGKGKWHDRQGGGQPKAQ